MFWGGVFPATLGLQKQTVTQINWYNKQLHIYTGRRYEERVAFT